MKTTIPLCFAIISASCAKAWADVPTEDDAKRVFATFSKHLVAGQYREAFALRADPYIQIVTTAEGKTHKLNITRQQALEGVEKLRKQGMNGINKHSVQVLSSAKKDDVLELRVFVDISPGKPAEATYRMKNVDGSTLIVEEAYHVEAKQ